MPAALDAVQEAGAETAIREAAGRSSPHPVRLSPRLLFSRLTSTYSGFAITAKPSANLYILLQAGSAVVLIPFLFLFPFTCTGTLDEPCHIKHLSTPHMQHALSSFEAELFPLRMSGGWVSTV